MLCPEVCNFPPPKIKTSTKRNLNLNQTQEVINMNNFYRSIVLTFPDEMQTPAEVEEAVTLDTEFYKITKCPLALFLEEKFVNAFVKNGKLFCLTVGTDCIIDNCAAITPDGVLKVHVPEYTYQCLGLEGSKAPLEFREVKIDLTNTAQLLKAKTGLKKLGEFDFFITWEPDDDNVCPSTIAKYFHDNNINVAVMRQEIMKTTPEIKTVPSIDADPSELAEWIGMLAIGGDLSPTHDYVSSYFEPECDNPLPTTRISVAIIKGFFTPILLNSICSKVSEYVKSRDTEHYWAAVSVQSFTDCPWRWNYSSPQVFQSQDSSTTVFFTKKSNTVYSVGQIKI